MNTMNKNKSGLWAGLAAILLMGCAPATETAMKESKGPPSLSTIWTTTGFEHPESVLLSADRSWLYVSNIVGEGTERDGNGHIARVSKQGEILQAKWAVGMDAPKGMALNGDKLYVSDIDKLIEIDTNTGAVLQTIVAAGAEFLNDVAFVPGLGVLVSDSGTQSLYLYDGNTLSVWLQHDLLAGINGLHVDGKRVLIATMRAGQLLSLDVQSKILSVLGDGMEDADGIKILVDGSYIISSWPGQIYHVSNEGETILLQDTAQAKIYMNDFELEGRTLYMANFEPGTVQAISVDW
ncbi:MAG: hypothetical protein COA47_09225 [Robiginitomaculum sp.]|nr:MAG: hypothetical protein COA47_09225 [Robiginitomaculum sp.]